MNHDLLDSLYASRRELTRLIIATGSQNISPDLMQGLVQQRDLITWTINRVLAADLAASVADVAQVAAAIDASTDKLKSLSAIAADIETAIGVVNDVLGAADSLLAAA